MPRFLDTLSDKTTYADYKYVMQDSGSYSFGGRYTYAELIEDINAPFKFKAVIEHYIAKDTDPSTSIESHLYYMTPDMFSARTLTELKGRVKIGITEPVKSLFGRQKGSAYKVRVMSVEELMEMDADTKQKRNVAIMELIIPKLALMSFSV